MLIVLYWNVQQVNAQETDNHAKYAQQDFFSYFREKGGWLPGT